MQTAVSVEVGRTTLETGSVEIGVGSGGTGAHAYQIDIVDVGVRQARRHTGPVIGYILPVEPVRTDVHA